MDRITQHSIIDTVSEYLKDGEQLVSLGVFKKLPSTSFFLLTRGIAWMLTQDFYVGATDQRVIVLPVSHKKLGKVIFEDAFFVRYDEVELTEDVFNNTILKIKKIYRGYHLKLRFKTRDRTLDWSPFEFIAAVQQGKKISEKIHL